MCVCISLCTTVVHNTAQNSSDNLFSYSPDNHHSSEKCSHVDNVCDVHVRGIDHGSNNVVQPKDHPFLGLGRWLTSFGEMCPKNPPKKGVNRMFKPNCQNLKIAISRKPYIRSVQNLMTKLTPSTAGRWWSIRVVYEILECGPMPNMMVALRNIGCALCSTPQSLADAHY